MDRFQGHLGIVDVSFLIEVRDRDHADHIVKLLNQEGISVLKDASVNSLIS